MQVLLHRTCRRTSWLPNAALQYAFVSAAWIHAHYLQIFSSIVRQQRAFISLWFFPLIASHILWCVKFAIVVAKLQPLCIVCSSISIILEIFVRQSFFKLIRVSLVCCPFRRALQYPHLLAMSCCLQLIIIGEGVLIRFPLCACRA